MRHHHHHRNFGHWGQMKRRVRLLPVIVLPEYADIAYDDLKAALFFTSVLLFALFPLLDTYFEIISATGVLVSIVYCYS